MTSSLMLGMLEAVQEKMSIFSLKARIKHARPRLVETLFEPFRLGHGRPKDLIEAFSLVNPTAGPTHP